MRRVSRCLAAVAILLASHAGPSPTLAINKAWIRNITDDWADSTAWSPSGVPTAADTALITNAITANRTVRYFTTSTIQDLIISNSTAFAHTLLITNGANLQVTGNTLIGRNAIVQLGASTTQGSLTAQDLTLLDNARISFINSSGAGQNTLTVNGSFSNAPTTLIEGVSGGGSPMISFTADQPVTNHGTIRLNVSGAGAFSTVAVANQNTFYNAGTVQYIHDGSTTSRSHFLSNRFVNAGLLLVTNASSSASGSLIVNISNGLTNSAGATVRVVSTGGDHTRLVVNTGNLVNLGTLNVENQVANRETFVVTEAAGSVLSNATGGHVVIQNHNAGSISLRAGTAAGGTVVNAGTLTVNGGTLEIRRATTGARDFQNAGVVQLNNATLQATGLITNHSSAQIRVTGTAGTIHTPLVNNGTVAVHSGTLTVNGVFTNFGTVSFLNSLGTFTAPVVNRGAWLTDPTTNVFLSDFTVTSSGYISAAADDVFIFRSNFVNQSSQNTLWNTLNVTPGTNTIGQGTKFIFQGTGLTQTQQFHHVGLLDTDVFIGVPNPLTTGIQPVTVAEGFELNFALGNLTLTNTTLLIQQAFPSATTNALFVNDLFLYDAHLIIGNNMRVYFVNSNNWSSANVTLLGTAELHQLVFVPEPSTWLLVLAGAALLRWQYHRRRG